MPNIDDNSIARESLMSSPSTETLSKSNLTPSFAFILAVSQGLTELLLFGYAVKVLMPDGFTLAEGASLYEAVYNQAYNYAIEYSSPTDAQEYALELAYNHFNNFKFGLPLTTDCYTMLAVLSLAALSVVWKSFRLLFNHYAGNIDLRYPLPREDCSEEIIMQSQAFLSQNTERSPVILEYFYLNLAIGNQEKEHTTAYYMFSISHRLVNRHVHPYLPSLSQIYSFSCVAIVSALYIALIQNTYNTIKGLSYYEQYKNEKLEYDMAQKANYCSQTEASMLSCNSHECAYGSEAALYEQVNHIGFNLRFWYLAGPIFAAALTPVLDRVYKWRFGCATKLSPVFTFVQLVGQNLPKILIFNLAVNELLSGGYAIYSGKSLYNSMYEKMYIYATTPFAQGGLGKSPEDGVVYAMLMAYNFFIDFINQNMLTWSTSLTIAILVFAAIDLIIRAFYLLSAHRSGLIRLDYPISDDEKEQYLLSSPREWEDEYSLPTFIGGRYVNKAVEDISLRKTWVHWLYERAYRIINTKIHRKIPSLAECYSPVKITLVSVLTAAIILNIYIYMKAQAIYNRQYWKKYNLLASPTDTEQMTLSYKSYAAQYGAGYALNEIMALMSDRLGQTFYLAPLVATTVIFILILIFFNLKMPCHKQNTSNDNKSISPERESEDYRLLSDATSDATSDADEESQTIWANFFDCATKVICCDSAICAARD